MTTASWDEFQERTVFQQPTGKPAIAAVAADRLRHLTEDSAATQSRVEASKETRQRPPGSAPLCFRTAITSEP